MVMRVIKDSGFRVKGLGLKNGQNTAVGKRMNLAEFRERLRDAAKLKGIITPAQFADYMKVGRQTGHNWWTGNTRHLKAADLFAISDRLGISARWLLTGEPPMIRGQRTPTPDEQRVLDLFRALPEAWREDWVSQGNRILERLDLKPTPSNPYPSRQMINKT